MDQLVGNPIALNCSVIVGNIPPAWLLTWLEYLVLLMLTAICLASRLITCPPVRLSSCTVSTDSPFTFRVFPTVPVKPDGPLA